jgi:predicted RNA-binding protein with TRAM domain
MAYDRRGGRGGFRGRFSRRPRFGGRDFDVPKPIKVGEEYDVEINEVGSKGDGIARIKNFVVFVANSKKGDKIKVKITDVRNRFAIAEKIGEASGETEEAEAQAEAAETAEAPSEEAEAPVEETEEVSEAESESKPEVESVEETGEDVEASTEEDQE